MAYYVMVGEGIYPIAAIEDCHSDHLEVDSWMRGELLTMTVPEPIVYDLADDTKYEYDQIPNIRTLSKGLPIPFMRNDLYEALLAAGVDNLQVYDAVIRDLQRGVDHKNFKAFNIVGTIAAADMTASTMMGTSVSTMIDADFDRLVIDESKCHGHLLFRLSENITAIIVHESIKKEVEKRNIEGVFFYANNEWSG
jgi:hypothetical protein